MLAPAKSTGDTAKVTFVASERETVPANEPSDNHPSVPEPLFVKAPAALEGNPLPEGQLVPLITVAPKALVPEITTAWPTTGGPLLPLKSTRLVGVGQYPTMVLLELLAAAFALVSAMLVIVPKDTLVNTGLKLVRPRGLT